MKTLQTSIPGVLILEPRVIHDDRGWFMETFNAQVFRELGLPEDFPQDNHSVSLRSVVRGLHYQLDEPQGKLIRCVRGAIRDVAVDIRPGSPTFGKWDGVELSAENRRMLWIPPRFAHGFAVITDEAEVIYKCTTLWDPKSDRSILWNDPAIAIDWGVENPIISEKDAAAPLLRDAEIYEP